jgi:hypothetical protein
MTRSEPSPLVRPEADASLTRWELIRDVLVLQAKLVLDGMRDLAFAPASLIAAGAGLLVGGDRPGRYFQSLLRIGLRSEEWINLFGAAEREASERRGDSRSAGVDLVFSRLERIIVDQYQRGGVTASAKDALDRVLDTVQRTPAAGTSAEPGSLERR